MARDFHINGESLVLVKGASNTAISSLAQLGLAAGPIIVQADLAHFDLNVDAWGDVPADVQWMLGGLTITMDLIHYDRDVLNVCHSLSMGGALALTPGQMARAGTRMGGGFARFAAGNRYIGLNIASPQEGIPWRFFYAYIVSGWTYELSVKRTVTQVTWEVVPYTQDPWGAGLGASNYPLWDHTLDV